MEEITVLEQIRKRLDILISLELGKAMTDKPTSIATRISRLNELGLLPSEIAVILGKSTNYITATLSKKKPVSKEERR